MLHLSRHYRRLIYLLLGLLLTLRLAAMALIPLTDDTEARYGEIARKMVENGNWVTPMGLHGPFWAKPPLSTWVSALSMQWFGISAFASRLPNLLLMILTIAMVYALVTQKRGKDAGLFATLVAASMLLTFVVAGTVMTDTTLVFATTWGLFAFWQARQTGLKRWGYLLFAALGVGLLAKGPVAIVLTGMPIFCWALWQKDLKASLRCLPWVGGILLMLAIALPWYLLAEHRTPGFLRYFIVGENIERFINPGWVGDKFGSSHLHPYGTIWVFWLAAAFPWSILIMAWLMKGGRRALKQTFDHNQPLARYLLLAAFMPELFFTFARNIIATYPLVGLPPLAALMALVLWEKRPVSGGRLVSPALVTAIIGLLAILAFCAVPPEQAPKQSQKAVIATWQALRPTATTPLAYYGDHYYSAYFYSHGKVSYLDNTAALAHFLQQHPTAFVVMHSDQLAALPSALHQDLTLIKRFPYVSLFSAHSAAPQGGTP